MVKRVRVRVGLGLRLGMPPAGMHMAVIPVQSVRSRSARLARKAWSHQAVAWHRGSSYCGHQQLQFLSVDHLLAQQDCTMQDKTAVDLAEYLTALSSCTWWKPCSLKKRRATPWYPVTTRSGVASVQSDIACADA